MVRMLAFAALLWCSTAAATSIDFHWDPATPRAGEPVELVVAVGDIDALYGVQLALEYEGGALVAEQQAPVTPGDLVVSEGGITLRNATDARNQTVTWVYSRMRPDADVEGSGELARIRFLAKEGGTGTVEMTELKLADSAGVVVQPSFSPIPGLRVYAAEELLPQSQGEGISPLIFYGGGLIAGLILVGVWALRRRRAPAAKS